MMEAWWTGAEKLPFVHPDGGSYTSGPSKGALHTTESYIYYPSTTTYYGHRNPPHFTVWVANTTGKVRMVQHYPITRAARALRNESGGVQTNRNSAIQLEIAWKAANAAAMPTALLDKIREWMQWVEQQTDINHKFKSNPMAKSYAEANAPGHRMSFAQWDAWNGWCGHSDVPENTHWDPGNININYLLTGTRTIRPTEDPDMIQITSPLTRSSDVLWWQKKINDSGLLATKLAADGAYGPMTAAGVKTVRAKLGLEPIGVIDATFAAAFPASVATTGPHSHDARYVKKGTIITL